MFIIKKSFGDENIVNVNIKNNLELKRALRDAARYKNVHEINFKAGNNILIDSEMRNGVLDLEFSEDPIIDHDLSNLIVGESIGHITFSDPPTVPGGLISIALVISGATGSNAIWLRGDGGIDVFSNDDEKSIRVLDAWTDSFEDELFSWDKDLKRLTLKKENSVSAISSDIAGVTIPTGVGTYVDFIPTPTAGYEIDNDTIQLNENNELTAVKDKTSVKSTVLGFEGDIEGKELFPSLPDGRLKIPYADKDILEGDNKKFKELVSGDNLKGQTINLNDLLQDILSREVNIGSYVETNFIVNSPPNAPIGWGFNLRTRRQRTSEEDNIEIRIYNRGNQSEARLIYDNGTWMDGFNNWMRFTFDNISKTLTYNSDVNTFISASGGSFGEIELQGPPIEYIDDGIIKPESDTIFIKNGRLEVKDLYGYDLIELEAGDNVGLFKFIKTPPQVSNNIYTFKRSDNTEFQLQLISPSEIYLWLNTQTGGTVNKLALRSNSIGGWANDFTEDYVTWIQTNINPDNRELLINGGAVFKEVSNKLNNYDVVKYKLHVSDNKPLDLHNIINGEDLGLIKFLKDTIPITGNDWSIGIAIGTSSFSNHQLTYASGDLLLNTGTNEYEIYTNGDYADSWSDSQYEWNKTWRTLSVKDFNEITVGIPAPLGLATYRNYYPVTGNEGGEQVPDFVYDYGLGQYNMSPGGYDEDVVTLPDEFKGVSNVKLDGIFKVRPIGDDDWKVVNLTGGYTKLHYDNNNRSKTVEVFLRYDSSLPEYESFLFIRMYNDTDDELEFSCVVELYIES